MKVLFKILKWVGIILLVLIVILVIQVIVSQRQQAEDQAMMVKADEDLIGTHIYISRDGEKEIDVNL